MLAGAILASGGFLLEFYKFIDEMWETKLGKVLTFLLGSVIAAIAVGLAKQVVNEATGMDPEHFPLTTAIVAPLSAGYLLGVAAWLAVVFGYLWFFVETFADMLRTGWAWTLGEKYKSKDPMQSGLRFCAVIVMTHLLAITWGVGQRPYDSFLSWSAGWIAYGLETYGSDPCRLPNATVRRLSDDIVVDGVVKAGKVTFQIRQCALGQTAAPAKPR